MRQYEKNLKEVGKQIQIYKTRLSDTSSKIKEEQRTLLEDQQTLTYSQVEGRNRMINSMVADVVHYEKMIEMLEVRYKTLESLINQY